MALSPSGHWHARLYCWTLYINCFFLGFRQWQSPADRVSTLIMNIWLPLPVFWSPWSRTDSDQGPDTATWVGLAHGCDYSYCRASRCLRAKATLGPCFSLNCRKYLKTRALCEGFSTLIPQTDVTCKNTSSSWLSKCSSSLTWSQYADNSVTQPRLAGGCKAIVLWLKL